MQGEALKKLLLAFRAITRERGHPEIADRYAAAAEQTVQGVSHSYRKAWIGFNAAAVRALGHFTGWQDRSRR